MRRALALAGVLLVSARTAQADIGDYLGRPVARVQFDIEGQPAAPGRLAPLVLTRVGEQLA
jgi:hypothetical protein